MLARSSNTCWCRGRVQELSNIDVVSVVAAISYHGVREPPSSPPPPCSLALLQMSTRVQTSLAQTAQAVWQHAQTWPTQPWTAPQAALALVQLAVCTQMTQQAVLTWTHAATGLATRVVATGLQRVWIPPEEPTAQQASTRAWVLGGGRSRNIPLLAGKDP